MRFIAQPSIGYWLLFVWLFQCVCDLNTPGFIFFKPVNPPVKEVIQAS